MTTNDTPAQTAPAETEPSTAVRDWLRIGVIAGFVLLGADVAHQVAQHHAPAALITAVGFSFVTNGFAFASRIEGTPKPSPTTFTCAATGCPVTVTNPMPLHAVLVDPAGKAIPDEAFTPVIPEMDDDTLFIGHITRDEANRRLRACGVENPLHGTPVVQGDVLHAWVLFERHQGHCADHNDSSRDHNPWHAIHVSAGSRGAIPVTFAFADEEW